MSKPFGALGLSQQSADDVVNFIINYDIKYRMGDDLFEEEGDE